MAKYQEKRLARGCIRACAMKLLPVARLCVVLTVVSLLTEDPGARFEKFCRFDMMLCGLCADCCDGERVGLLSAA